MKSKGETIKRYEGDQTYAMKNSAAMKHDKVEVV